MLAALFIAVVIAITLGGVAVGSAVVARHRAQAAADLAALAGAAGLPAGEQQACGQADAVAAAMHSGRVQCTVDGLDVLVSVEVAVSFPRGVLGPARAAARAGPAAPP